MKAVWLLALLATFLAVAPLLAPHDPTDLAHLELMDSVLPPWWDDGGSTRFPLGTDTQGRCLLSSIVYGLRLSLVVSMTVVVWSIALGSVVGLWSGYAGGIFDQASMRIADAALSIHPVLLALVFAAVLRRLAPIEWGQGAGTLVVIAALGAVGWAPYARSARALAHAQRELPYVQAAWLMGRNAPQILVTHILPNIAPALGALAVAQLGQAVFAESTLSFLGAGLPPTQPSLGGLIRTGTDFLLSGGWWMAALPAAALALLIGTLGWLADMATARGG